MKFYIAARFGRRAECFELAKYLESLGHLVTSRWVRPDSGHDKPRDSAQGTHAEKARWAAEDFNDVRACETLVSLQEEPRGASRGGRHVEFGIALAQDKKIIVIGPRETIFHELSFITHFSNIEEFKSAELQTPT